MKECILEYPESGNKIVFKAVNDNVAIMCCILIIGGDFRIEYKPRGESLVTVVECQMMSNLIYREDQYYCSPVLRTEISLEMFEGIKAREFIKENKDDIIFCLESCVDIGQKPKLVFDSKTNNCVMRAKQWIERFKMNKFNIRDKDSRPQWIDVSTSE